MKTAKEMFEEEKQEIKQETNFEHYKDEIIEDYAQNLAVVKGRPSLCYKTNCNDCDFKINQIGCREKAKDWLNKPYEKPKYKLTQFEYDLLSVHKDYKTYNNIANQIQIHDGEKAHNELIEKLHLRSEVYKADSKSNDYLLHMALINNLCSWIKRYIYRFVGMRKENLQSYLNWFVYLLRVKNSTNKWPKLERILRHLILNEGTFTK